MAAVQGVQAAPDIEDALCYLSPEERERIQAVMRRAHDLEQEHTNFVKSNETEYRNFAAEITKRQENVNTSLPICPICCARVLRENRRLREGQNVCVDCEQIVCSSCGSFETSLTTKLKEWICQMCNKRRKYVLSAGSWLQHSQEKQDEEQTLPKSGSVSGLSDKVSPPNHSTPVATGSTESPASRPGFLPVQQETTDTPPASHSQYHTIDGPAFDDDESAIYIYPKLSPEQSREPGHNHNEPGNEDLTDGNLAGMRHFHQHQSNGAGFTEDYFMSEEEELNSLSQHSIGMLPGGHAKDHGSFPPLSQHMAPHHELERNRSGQYIHPDEYVNDVIIEELDEEQLSQDMYASALAVPQPSDWIPTTDLSPIEDVSPTLELEAEAEWLASQAEHSGKLVTFTSSPSRELLSVNVVPASVSSQPIASSTPEQPNEIPASSETMSPKDRDLKDDTKDGEESLPPELVMIKRFTEEMEHDLSPRKGLHASENHDQPPDEKSTGERNSKGSVAAVGPVMDKKRKAPPIPLKKPPVPPKPQGLSKLLTARDHGENRESKFLPVQKREKGPGAKHGDTGELSLAGGLKSSGKEELEEEFVVPTDGVSYNIHGGRDMFNCLSPSSEYLSPECLSPEFLSPACLSPECPPRDGMTVEDNCDFLNNLDPREHIAPPQYRAMVANVDVGDQIVDAQGKDVSTLVTTKAAVTGPGAPCNLTANNDLVMAGSVNHVPTPVPKPRRRKPSNPSATTNEAFAGASHPIVTAESDEEIMEIRFDKSSKMAMMKAQLDMDQSPQSDIKHSVSRGTSSSIDSGFVKSASSVEHSSIHSDIQPPSYPTPSAGAFSTQKMFDRAEQQEADGRTLTRDLEKQLEQIRRLEERQRNILQKALKQVIDSAQGSAYSSSGVKSTPLHPRFNIDMRELMSPSFNRKFSAGSPATPRHSPFLADINELQHAYDTRTISHLHSQAVLREMAREQRGLNFAELAELSPATSHRVMSSLAAGAGDRIEQYGNDLNSAVRHPTPAVARFRAASPFRLSASHSELQQPWDVGGAACGYSSDRESYTHRSGCGRGRLGQVREASPEFRKHFLHNEIEKRQRQLTENNRLRVELQSILESGSIPLHDYTRIRELYQDHMQQNLNLSNCSLSSNASSALIRPLSDCEEDSCRSEAGSYRGAQGDGSTDPESYSSREYLASRSHYEQHSLHHPHSEQQAPTRPPHHASRGMDSGDGYGIPAQSGVRCHIIEEDDNTYCGAPMPPMGPVVSPPVGGHTLSPFKSISGSRMISPTDQTVELSNDGSQISLGDPDEKLMDSKLEGGKIIRAAGKFKEEKVVDVAEVREKLPVKKILLIPDNPSKTKGLGLEVVGGRPIPGDEDKRGAFVVRIQPGTIAAQLKGELREGDEIVEWNGVYLRGKPDLVVQDVITHWGCEIEVAVRLEPDKKKRRYAARSRSTSPESPSQVPQSTTSSPTEVGPRLFASDGQFMPAPKQQALITRTSPNAQPTRGPLQSSFSKSRPEIATGNATYTPGTSPLLLDSSHLPDILDHNANVTGDQVLSSPDSLQTAAAKPQRKSRSMGPRDAPLSSDGMLGDRLLQPSTSRSAGNSPVKRLTNCGQIHVQFTYDEPKQMLVVGIEKAARLALFGKEILNPFVKLHFISKESITEKRCTRYIEKNTNPKWHQSFTFSTDRAELPERAIRFSVWDFFAGSQNTFIGSVLVQLKEELLDSALRALTLSSEPVERKPRSGRHSQKRKVSQSTPNTPKFRESLPE